MSASLLVKATKLQECVAAVRVVTATQQDAARLNERLSTLRSKLVDLRRAQAVYLACRAADGEGALREPDTASLAAALSTFRAAHQEQGDLDQAALSLSAAMNALRDDLRNRVAAWWPLHASARVRDAGADAIDLLEPDDQAAARALVDRLRESVGAPPRIPLDIARFQNAIWLPSRSWSRRTRWQTCPSSCARCSARSVPVACVCRISPARPWSC